MQIKKRNPISCAIACSTVEDVILRAAARDIINPWRFENRRERAFLARSVCAVAWTHATAFQIAQIHRMQKRNELDKVI